MRRWVALVCFFLLCFIQASGQEISGYVYDAKTQEVVVGASVYYDGTSIGTITNLEGKFTLSTPKKIQANLVVKYIGYQTVYLSNPGQNIRVYLEENITELNEVVVEPDTWSRRKKMRVFREEFLGKGDHNCKILNEADIRLYYKKSENTLYAYTEVPIQILNRKLGYNISYDLQGFEVVFNNYANIDTSVESAYFYGTSFFEDISESDDNRTSKLRNKAYNGSLFHFLRALYRNKTGVDGFDLFKARFPAAVDTCFQMQMQDDELLFVAETTQQIDIRFNKEKWSFIRIKKPFHVDYLGNFSPPDAVISGGEMGKNRIGRMLPLDYGLDN